MKALRTLEDYVDHAAYYLGPVAIVFLAAYFVTYRHSFHVAEAHKHLWMVWVAGVCGFVIIPRLLHMCLLNRARAGGSHAKELHAKAISLFFVLGVALGSLSRLLHNGLQLGNFFIGSAALIGGLIVGFVFEASKQTQPDRTPRYREVSIAYLLLGALCAVFGLAPSTNVIEQGYFLSVCGSLAASSYVVFRAATGIQDVAVGGSAA